MKPSPAERAALSAVLQHDITSLQRLDSQLQGFRQDLSVPTPAFRDLAAAAFVLHSLYTALENSFEQTSRTFENHVRVPDQWHKELLGKMFLNIPMVRPAVLPESLRGFLNDLRGFRHLFRHAYDFEIDPVRLKRMIDDWDRNRDELLNSLELFRRYLLPEDPKETPSAH
jgi:hypothetical protein